jgi:predicted nucleic acid-binding Zn ribbon protein
LKEGSYLGDLLKSLLSDLGQGDLLELGKIHDRWAEIAGERLSGRSEPVSLKEGRLVVLTPAPAWTSEVHMSAPSLIRRIEEETGVVVVEIRVKTDPEAGRWQEKPT